MAVRRTRHVKKGKGETARPIGGTKIPDGAHHVRYLLWPHSDSALPMTETTAALQTAWFYPRWANWGWTRLRPSVGKDSLRVDPERLLDREGGSRRTS
jgi:hypothetical protein